MFNEKEYLLKEFEFASFTSKEEIEKVELKLDVKFPSDYKDFMLLTNGGEGPIGNSYLRLWNIEELVNSNEDYAVTEFAPGLVIIGSDGGGAAYGYDFRQDQPLLVEVDFIGMDIDYPNYCTNSFLGFLENLYNGY